MNIYGFLTSREGPKVSCLCILVLFYHFEVSSCLQVCYVCHHVRDFSACQQNVRVCPQGEICFTSESLSNYGFLVYSAGCASRQTCDSLSTSSLEGPNKHGTHAPVRPNNIVGKRTTRTCYRCCENEGDMYRLCNMDRCSMQLTSKSTTRSISFTSISPTTTPFSSLANLTTSWTTPISSTPRPISSTKIPTSSITPTVSTKRHTLSTTKPTSISTTTTSLMTSTLSTTRHTLSTTKPTLISAIPNSSINLNLSTIRHTLSATKPTSILTTPTPFTTTPTSSTPTSSLTTPISYTTPILSTTTPSTTASPTSCYLCNGMPIYICEQFSTPLQCEHDDQQFCLNILVNNRDGSRTLDRRCVNEQECQQEWWEKTSDRPECSGYDPASYTPKYFTCSYCCTTPLCNKNIVPKDLYVPTKK